MGVSLDEFLPPAAASIVLPSGKTVEAVPLCAADEAMVHRLCRPPAPPRTDERGRPAPGEAERWAGDRAEFNNRAELAELAVALGLEFPNRQNALGPDPLRWTDERDNSDGKGDEYKGGVLAARREAFVQAAVDDLGRRVSRDWVAGAVDALRASANGTGGTGAETGDPTEGGEGSPGSEGSSGD